MYWLLLILAVVLIVTAVWWYYTIKNTCCIPKYEIYITMTTLPERLLSKHFQNVVDRLLDQKLAPDMIILNVPYQLQRTGEQYTIPEWIQNVPKVKVVRCDDQGPATKLLGGLQQIPNTALVVVADDDIIYSRNFISDLYKTWTSRRGLVSNAVRDEDWKIPCGYAGYILHKSDLKGIQELPFPSECRYVDDDWLGWCYNKLEVSVYENTSDFWDQAATDEHPKWFELNTDTERNKLTEQCKSMLTL